MPDATHDVVITGGGPAGSTAATILRKYMPDLSVLIVEKERFPRDHVGESQLPLISTILNEMGCWEKVEAAGFPIKVGATYTWGRDPQPWHFNFVPPEEFRDEPRPARFEGQRRYTAFQVDRARYDDILLRHALDMGCEVREGVAVDRVDHADDRIDSLFLSDGSTVTGRYVIDASGTSGVIRRSLAIETESPPELRNIAVWDYWENAEWAEEIGVGGTRVQVRSLPYGWIWFIPLGPTRTSIGFICHADYYRDSGESHESLYQRAVRDEPLIAELIEQATARGSVEATKDWSFLAERTCGENWFLTGESAGFADPILAAGMTLAHTSARDAAYTIMELERGEHDRDWLLKRYDHKTRESIEHHIRFAQYWYAANGLQSDLQENCAKIARSAGIRLNARDAFRWISQGAFTTELLGNPSIGFFDLTSIHDLTNRFSTRDRAHSWLIDGCSEFILNLHNAQTGFVGDLRDGRIDKIPCLMKGNQKLPLHEFYRVTVEALRQTSDAQTLLRIAHNTIDMLFPPEHRPFAYSRVIEVLEALALDGWVMCRKNKKRPPLVLDARARTIVSEHEA